MEQTNNFYEELQNSDWLGRNPNDYTYQKKGLSIGWEETLTEGDPYSRFILKVNSNKLDVKKKVMLTKQVCTNILSRMNVSKRPARIVFTNDFSSWQMKDLVCVTLEPLSGKIKFPSFNHELDPIVGFCVHEIAHLLYTDEEYERYINKFQGTEGQIKQTIMNVLEDERIEQLVAETFRGYTGYVGKAKDYCFGKRLTEEMRLNRVDDDIEINQLMQTFLHLLRYPKALREDYVNKFEKPLKKVMNILSPYPSDIPEMTVATEKIYNVFKDFYEDKEDDGDGQGDGSGQSQQQQAQAQTEDSTSSVSMGSGSGSQNETDKDQQDNKEQDNDQNENKDDQTNENDQTDKETEQDKGGQGNDQQEQDEQEGDDEENSSNGEGSEDGEDEQEQEDGNGNGDDEDSSDDDDTEKQENSGGEQKSDTDDNKPSMEEALQGMLEAIKSAEPRSGDSEEVATMIKGDYSVPKILDEINEYDNDDIGKRQSFSHIYPQTENLNTSELSVIFNDADKELHSSENHYDRALSEVRTYASSLRAKIQQLNRNQTIVNSGLSEGDFDDALLVDAIVGSKNVYKEEHRMMNRGACVGLLIDESGSMGWGAKWFEAMKIAVLFERALEGVNNVDFYCYGHTTGNSFKRSGYEDATIINVYYEGRKTSNRKILGKIHAHNTNRDGHAILETIGRMREKVKKEIPIILFMISDGEPSASVPHGYNGTTYTKKAVNTVEKYANATVIHIAIEHGIPSHEMFNTFVEFSDHSKLVRDIGGLLKAIMIRQQKAVVL